MQTNLAATMLPIAGLVLGVLACAPVAFTAEIPNSGAESAAFRGAAAAFRGAEGSRAWSFPRDHGQHPEFKLEWWYYTGIVSAEDGSRFGFQVTFFRRGLAPEFPRRDSAWAARSLFAAQAALSVLPNGSRSGRFLHRGLSGRESLGIAGAAPDGQRVWVRSWRAEPLEGGAHAVRLSVPAGNFTLDLSLRSEREPVLHGAGGLDQKGAAPGQASWYYSLTRLRVTGTVVLDGQTVDVRGMAWMDHEFGSSQLDAGQAGWDWFGLRFSDGSDLMLYRLRGRDGTVDSYSGGTWVSPGGQFETFEWNAQFSGKAEPMNEWVSPASGARYPVSWSIELPKQGLRFTLKPALLAQEMTATPGIPFAYWEGAVYGEGAIHGKPVTGEGYLELTGYGGEIVPNLR